MTIDNLPENLSVKFELIKESTTLSGTLKNLRGLLDELEKTNKENPKYFLQFKLIKSKHLTLIKQNEELKQEYFSWFLNNYRKLNTTLLNSPHMTSPSMEKISSILCGDVQLPLEFSDLSRLERVPAVILLHNMLCLSIEELASYGIFEELQEFAKFETCSKEIIRCEERYSYIPIEEEKVIIYPESNLGKQLANTLKHGFIGCELLPPVHSVELPPQLKILFGSVHQLKREPESLNKLREIENTFIRAEKQDTNPEALLNDLLFYQNLEKHSEDPKLEGEQINLQDISTLMELDARLENRYSREIYKIAHKSEGFKFFHYIIINQVHRFLIHLQNSSLKLNPSEVKSQNAKDEVEFAGEKLAYIVNKMSNSERPYFTNDLAIKYVEKEAKKNSINCSERSIKVACKELRDKTDLEWEPKRGRLSNKEKSIKHKIQEHYL